MAEIEKLSATSADMEAGGTADVGASDLGTSPTQERSSNYSHPHDSEYDTASDLESEGGDDYNSESDGESITDDDGDNYDDEENNDDNEQGSQTDDKLETEPQKKVDEDRSNPQYIPKRGTFYEHDDRTTEIEGECVTTGEGESYEGNGKGTQAPIISHASKTMKKWQAASGVERWSHDRFDASEQAPKSRQELVTAYGYDIRTEEAPPRARRRRRYGRGPSKYSRNWEDETAYLKASNKERKPPRASDFPALSERNVKPRKPTREEKENRVNKRQTAASGSGHISEKNNQPSRSIHNEDRDRKERSDGKNNRNKNYGKQAALEFKQKRNVAPHQTMTPNNNTQNNRPDTQNERNTSRPQNSQINEPQRPIAKGISQLQKHQSVQSQQNDPCNNNTNKIKLEQAYQQPPQQARQPAAHKSAPTSNLAQRLQVQNRNDPSHVGSVQMHSLVAQNQHVAGVQQQQAANIIVPMQQQQQQQIPQEQRGPPKRYSSLRRSQHESQHIADHQLQQIHLPQQQQQPILIQDQHIIQANLMQLYHQENLQAQMQALQVGPTSSASKQPTYASVPTPGQPQPQPFGGAPGTSAGPTAYYVAAPGAYASTGNANPQPPSAAQYSQQPQNFLSAAPTGPAATTLAYASGPQPAQQVLPVANTPTTAGANPNQNYPNYQNYNTVGGTTYFVPSAPQTARPVVLPQRRPTNAIPILPPSEKNKYTPEVKEEELKNNGVTSAGSSDSMGSSEFINQSIDVSMNIDHIIDNMFVQRPAYQPPQVSNSTRTSTSPPAGENVTVKSDSNQDPVAQSEEISIGSTEKESLNSTDANILEVSNGNSKPVSVQE